MKKKSLMVIVFALVAMLTMALVACVDGNPETDNSIPNPPKYIGFKYETQTAQAQSYQSAMLAYDGENNGNVQILAADGNEDYKDSQGNYGGTIEQRQDATLVLIYENTQRDTILDILVDDSIEGINRVYTTSSDVNKILKIDTVFNAERNTYISEVHLLIKGIEAVGERKIEIKETTFLREAISGKAVIDASAKKKIYYQVERVFFKIIFDLQRADGAFYDQSWRGEIGENIVRNGRYYGDFGDVGMEYRSLPSCYQNNDDNRSYVFDGWWTEENGGGIQIKGDTIVDLTADQTLYAKWVYTALRRVRFDGNGNTDGKVADMIGYDWWMPVGGTVIIEADIYEKENHEFIGWNTKSDGSGDSYNVELEKIPLPAGDTPFILYAQWVEVGTLDALVSFHGNGSTGGEHNSVWIPKGSAYELPECGFTKEGYRFVAWAIKINQHSENYHAVGSTGSLYTVPLDKPFLVLFALWEKI